MSLLLGQTPKLCLRKPVFVRASPPLCPNGSSSSLLQTPPCSIIGADPCGPALGKLVIRYANECHFTHLEKKVPMDLVYNDTTEAMVTIGSSHGWVATLKKGTLRLQDDLNPAASDSDPKRISLPPLVTLPHCQTQIVTNVAMSSPCPWEEDCVVAAKFLGHQLSFCRPGQPNSQWINVRIENPCFFSSQVMFSKKHDMFRMPGSGGHLIGSWDLRKHKHTPKLQELRYQNLPELTKTKRELLNSCSTSEHLVESQPTGETFLLKRFKKTTEIIDGIAKMKTKALMVFKLDEEGNAVYTEDIGDLTIFLSKSEPFCVPASSFPGVVSNYVHIFDFAEVGDVSLAKCHSDCTGGAGPFRYGFDAPYYIPPQDIQH
ncbi:hypothetical protein CARUB_v10011422mg [Capsella rubella]|uniref:KIB1-4 beta-propeller domain-containing protein n=1 Tax=Capsella rubella TaxID=81985 RepID=R0I683_9BRAS|nr:uncharacterized protein LOC17898723 [Capsella rubella]EOA37834.1 hypothetical protein CARUB_v10011422mg [Capsella rubella]